MAQPLTSSHPRLIAPKQRECFRSAGKQTHQLPHGNLMGAAEARKLKLASIASETMKPRGRPALLHFNHAAAVKTHGANITTTLTVPITNHSTFRTN
jgi:hypothetical protein